VAVAPVKEGAVSTRWTVAAEVLALEQAELAAGAAGPLEAVRVREGDRVERGAELARVETSVAGARRDQARAAAEQGAEELAQSERRLGRLEAAQGGVSAAELEAARSTAQSQRARQRGLEAAARLAEAELGRHLIRAPFAGLVRARHADAGDWVSPGSRVLDLVSTEGLELRALAPAALAAGIAPGARVEISGERGQKGEGTVLGRVPALDPERRSSPVRVQPQEGLSWLWPGAMARVTFAVTAEGGLVVPRDALVTGGGADRVMVAREGQSAAVNVLVLAAGVDELLVQAEGLLPGDSVVVRGNERLRPGTPLQIEDANGG
jgi:RND family efflux transporter MFP subunit